jgi:hypothetical protein
LQQAAQSYQSERSASSSVQETYSSSETFSSASHSSTESLPLRPPPLPPKKRHSTYLLRLCFLACSIAI